MTARLPSMIGCINLALKKQRSSIIVPINLLSYHVLTKLRDAGIIFGFSLILEQSEKIQLTLKGEKPRLKMKSMSGFPKAKIFLPPLPGYIRLKAYPLTKSHFISVRRQPFFRYRSFLKNRHGLNRYLLLTTTHGLKWDFELLHDGLGGKLLISVIRRL